MLNAEWGCARAFRSAPGLRLGACGLRLKMAASAFRGPKPPASSRKPRARLEELRLDYEGFLRQRALALWDRDGPRRQTLIDRRCATADEVAQWVRKEHDRGLSGRSGLRGQKQPSTTSTKSTRSNSTFPELAANAARVLLAVACRLLDRQQTGQENLPIVAALGDVVCDAGHHDSCYSCHSSECNRNARECQTEITRCLSLVFCPWFSA